MLVATVAALFAAACFAVAAAFQHRSAGLVAPTSRITGQGGFVAMTLRHPLWIVGTVADVAGFALHALALRAGPLTLVQPLLVTGVVFALPLRQFLERRGPSRQAIAWAGTLAVGLALFLVVATPADGATQPADPVPTAVVIVIVGLGVLGCGIAGRRKEGSTAAVALGVAAGLAFAAEAGLLKELTRIFTAGLGTVFMTWPLYGLVAVGVIGLLLNQLAYQAAPLRISLPIITTIDPIASLVIGVAVFDERFRHTPVDLLGEFVGLALVVTAAGALTRIGPQSAPQPTAGPAVTAGRTNPSSEAHEQKGRSLPHNLV